MVNSLLNNIDNIIDTFDFDITKQEINIEISD